MAKFRKVVAGRISCPKDNKIRDIRNCFKCNNFVGYASKEWAECSYVEGKKDE